MVKKIDTVFLFCNCGSCQFIAVSGKRLPENPLNENTIKCENCGAVICIEVKDIPGGKAVYLFEKEEV